MENLSISDAPPAAPPPQGPSQPGGPSQPPPQLPPQMFTTAAQLLDLTDSTLLVPSFPTILPSREGPSMFTVGA